MRKKSQNIKNHQMTGGKRGAKKWKKKTLKE